MKFVSYPKRIREGLDELMDAFYAERPPFTTEAMDFPQLERNLPRTLPQGELGEVNYWVGMCNFMLGAADSMTMARKYAVFFDENPDLFDWRIVQHLDPDTIRIKLEIYDLAFRASDVAQATVENARRIETSFDGDVRSAFRAAEGDWRRLYSLLMRTKTSGLIGFQEKMSSMLGNFLMSRRLVNSFLMPPQVDFHVMRVFWINNFVLPVQDDGRSIEVLRSHHPSYYATAIRPELVRYLEETGVYWTDLSDALWTQSRELCSQAPSNSTKKDNEEEVWQEPIEWTPELRQKFRKSCGVCALEHRCTGAVPANLFYRKKRKELRLWGPRQVPPVEEDGRLFNPEAPM